MATFTARFKSLAVATAALVGASTMAPIAAQAGDFHRHQVIQSWEHRPAPVRARDDGAALALGIVGGLALGVIAGSAIAQQHQPRHAPVYVAPPRHVAPAVRHRPRQPHFVDFYEYERPARFCEVVERRGFDSWGNRIVERVRTCR